MGWYSEGRGKLRAGAASGTDSGPKGTIWTCEVELGGVNEDCPPAGVRGETPPQECGASTGKLGPSGIAFEEGDLGDERAKFLKALFASLLASEIFCRNDSFLSELEEAMREGER